MGHLGQAYAWTIGLLGCPSKQAITLYLQDYDVSEVANWSAGLLCEDTNTGEMKTRIAGRWLEERGFNTRIVERPMTLDTPYEAHFRVLEVVPQKHLAKIETQIIDKEKQHVCTSGTAVVLNNKAIQ